MARFDPASATATYLAMLSPEAHQRAIDYTRGGYWMLLWGVLVTCLAAWLVLRSGMLVRLRDRLNRNGPRPNRTALLVAAAALLAVRLIELPWSIYADWWRERSYGLSSQSFAGWIGDEAKELPISLVMTSLFFLAFYALIRRAPRSWWVWASGVALAGIGFMVVIGPIFIEPIFNTYTPAPAGPMRDRVVALAEAAHVPHDKIYIFDGSRQSDRYTANVSGLFGTARIAMSDTMFKQGADTAEVIGVVGHEMGHYARHHIFWTLLVLSLLTIAGLWLSARLFPWLARRLPGAERVRGIADPAGLPLFFILFNLLALLGTPALNTLTRVTESDADIFSLRYAHEPDGMAKALVKTIAYRASSPTQVEEWLFYDHPSVERRVRRAMDWKAAHPDGTGAPFGPLPSDE
ncbi:M48 family metallopeptidase [Sphingomonas sp.]|uniref:M48 family metallopeptidase n=1 Tax=Sphingomonas sp. TaxID=28214 RepID=UPI003B3A48CF